MTHRVLIVDDNHELVDNLAELLGEEGYAVTTAYCAEEALSLGPRYVFDTVLSDVRMPGIDGLELVERLRGLSPKTIFLLMTAYCSEAVRDRAVNGGVGAILTKPLDIDLLLAHLSFDPASAS